MGIATSMYIKCCDNYYRAAIEKWKCINEYLGIDISNEMTELSEKIIKKHPKNFKGNFYRQYLPISNVSDF